MGANIDPLVLLRTLQQANGANPHGGYPSGYRVSFPASDANFGEASVILSQLADDARVEIDVPAGRGRLTRVPVVTPAAGAEWTITVPAGQTWELFSVTFLLTSSADAANRFAQVVVDDGTNVLTASQTAIAQVASLAPTYVFTAGLGVTASVVTAGSTIWAGALAPGIVIPGGYRVRSVTGNIQAADAYTAVAVWAYLT